MALWLRALVQQFGHRFRWKAVRLMQVQQVRLGQWPTGGELGEHLAAAGEQAGEPALLAVDELE